MSRSRVCCSTREERNPLSPEKGRFPYDHTDAIAAMAAEWNLPKSIQQPLALHHFPTRLTPGAGNPERLCALAYLIGSLCFTEDLNSDPSGKNLIAYAQEQFSLTPDDLQKCLAAAGESYKQASDLLGDALPDDLDVTELLVGRPMVVLLGDGGEVHQEQDRQGDGASPGTDDHRNAPAADSVIWPVPPLFACPGQLAREMPTCDLSARHSPRGFAAA